MMPASTATTLAKARDYLGSGRLTVTECDDVTGVFVAAVQGTERYVVFRGFATGPWHCTCPAGTRFGRECCHILAAALVAG